MQVAMINDQILPFEELDPAYLDRGTFFGDGVYEALRSYKGKIFALDDHLERFFRSIAEISIAGVDIQEVRARILRAYEKSGIEVAKIYFHITRGSGQRKHVCESSMQPNFFLMVTELPDNQQEKDAGIAASSHPDLRWKRCDIKSLNLLPNVLARLNAAKKGSAEAILVDEDGFITEGAGSAFFSIKGNCLQTSPLTHKILPSVSRKYILKAAEKIGLKIKEEPLALSEAYKCDEIIIAATTRGIVPVVKFDDEQIGSGKPGTLIKKISERFLKFTA